MSVASNWVLRRTPRAPRLPAETGDRLPSDDPVLMSVARLLAAADPTMAEAERFLAASRVPLAQSLADPPDSVPNEALQRVVGAARLPYAVLYARKADSLAALQTFFADNGISGNPFDMAGMRPAVIRLLQAMAREEQIVVYGDYDADGVSASALLVLGLRTLGARAEAYIPDRFSEAYGVNREALERLRDQGASLVVTVDCGIRNTAEALYARDELHLDLIVTDHHTVPEHVPEALAVINPKQPGCPYPFKDLAGVGVAYRLIQALYAARNAMRTSEEAPLDATQFLDLVALGTVADIVPLEGENRLLVRRGLQRLREAPRPGLEALLRVAGVGPGHAEAETIAFRLGPRLNAAGRVETARCALHLLLAQSTEEAEPLARELDSLNRERQALLDEQLTLAQGLLGEIGDRRVLFVAHEELHDGIVGLVASRLVDLHYRPALVLRANHEGARGSARSIEGFHVTQALERCADVLAKFGGHARAAGFSLASEDVPAFRARIEAVAEEWLADPILLERRRMVDTIVPLSALSRDAVCALGVLEPCGEGNPAPCLASRDVKLTEVRAVGQDGRHLRLRVYDGASTTLTAIAFRMGHLQETYRVGDLVDLIYSPALNAYNGNVSVQLVVQDIRPSASPSPEP